MLSVKLAEFGAYEVGSSDVFCGCKCNLVFEKCHVLKLVNKIEVR